MQHRATPVLLPIATALRKSLKSYTPAKLQQDILAAFVVSLVALPLSMALAIAVGLPPQHGLYTAIVAGIVVPLLGGSNWQVSGPTAAFVVILAPIVTELGLRGIIWAGIMAGFILVLLGVGRLGKLINYIPYPVTTGFTAGIAVVLATLSLNDFLGLGIGKLEGEFIHKVAVLFSHREAVDGPTVMVGALTLFLLFTAGRLVKFLPGAVIAMLAGTGVALLLAHMGHTVATIGSSFSYIAENGKSMPGVPPYLPVLHLPTLIEGSLFTLPSLQEFRHLLFPAFAIAILAALESLLSATVADSMAGTRHNPNAELVGIGIGNVLSAMATGIPATGAIARTATNINNGARSPLSSSLHAVLIMVYVLLLAPYIRYIPMACLAALLIHTAYRMSHYKQFLRILQIAPRSDVIVLLTCFILTVFVDMVAGVGIGILCAAFLLIQRMISLTEVEVASRKNGKGKKWKLPPGALIYRIRGPLFFGTIEKAFDRYNFAHDYIENFIVDISEVPFIDMTGLVAMKSMMASIAHEKRTVHIVCNIPEVAQKIRDKIDGHRVSTFVRFHKDMKAVLREIRKK